jgi:hypothetical protein
LSGSADFPASADDTYDNEKGPKNSPKMALQNFMLDDLMP